MGRFLLFLFIIILIVFIIAGAIYYVLNSAWITQRIVQKALGAMGDEITVERFTIDNQKFSFKGNFTLERILCIISDGIDRGGIHIDSITVSSIYSLLGLMGDENSMGIVIHNANFMGPYLRVEKAKLSSSVKFSKNRFESINGTVEVPSAVYDEWRISNGTAKIQGIPDSVKVNEINADFYDGKVTGTVEFKPFDNGLYTVDLVLDDVNILKLAHDQPDLFSQIEGTADVTVHIRGNQERIIEITADADVIKDSSIDAALIGPLIQYVPGSAQRNEIELLIRENKKIPLDTTKFSVKNIDSETIAATIQLMSKKVNLDINLTVDFRIEGGIENLMTLFQKQNKQGSSAKG